MSPVPGRSLQKQEEIIRSNAGLELAYDYICSTGEPVFLTGKAGTGKTTFLQRLKKEVNKRAVVLAPTGVAAINAGGMTIHSFFQLPFGPYVPGPKREKTSEGRQQSHKLRKEKINLIRSLDLLIIDEISMVRADLLDAVSDNLCRYRRDSRPFGGLQLLMIGDVQQLAPVAKEDEWALLRTVYDSPYFFSSQALLKTRYTTIALTEVFRQSDAFFLELLNKVRDNKLDEAGFRSLNQRHIPGFNPDDAEGYITLTTHNYQAQSINERKLAAIGQPEYCYKAEVQGLFPESSFPTNQELVLKKGAQVMFVKNDSSPERLYFNGKIGQITDLGGDYICVQCEGDSQEVMVQPEQWFNTKYTLDPDTKDIEETVEGVFEQYPLKLAWAITIHKSQGLTFEKVIIDAASAFAHGQVYVALSRCKTLEGIVLNRPLSRHVLKDDAVVSSFSREILNHPPDRQQLLKARREYFIDQLLDLFDFQELLLSLRLFNQQCRDQLEALYPAYVAGVGSACPACLNEITSVGLTFGNQIRRMSETCAELEQEPQLQERVHKAGLYFAEKLQQIIGAVLAASLPELDNKESRQLLEKAYSRLEQEYDYKAGLMREFSLRAFTVEEYLSIRAQLLLKSEEHKKKSGSKKEKKAKKTGPVYSVYEEAQSEAEREAVDYPYGDETEHQTPPAGSADIAHPLLYQQLAAWRRLEARELNRPAYTVLSQAALLGICRQPPLNTRELKKIRGIGPKTLEKYGDRLMEIIDSYLGLASAYSN
ncbi:MAG: AAA family ATPase [Bacteroidales bacterium]|nr:AAA family ATPase [Bacteroidales bacterium]